MTRPSKLRSAVTNKPFVLAGVDGRSSTGRRFRDVVDGLIAEFGTADIDRVRELAALMVTREASQAAAVKGDAEACETLVRLSNLISRREKELGRVASRNKPASGRPSLRDHLNGRYGGAA